MTKIQKNIGFDFDDVLIDFKSALLNFHNKEYGSTHAYHQITSHNLSLLWGCTDAEALRRGKEFVHSSSHRDILPIYEAVEIIRELQEKCTLLIITARSEELRAATFHLLEKYFSQSFKEVHFLHKNGVNVLGTKGDVCIKCGVDLFIEDTLSNAAHTGEAGIKTLLFNTPWNQAEVLPKNVKRIHTLREILKEII